MNFSQTLVRDIISRIGDIGNPAKLMADKAIQDFKIRTAFSDMKPLGLIKNMSDGFADQTFISTMLANKRNVLHNTFVDLWNVPTLTTSNLLTFAGFNTGSTQRKAIPVSAFGLKAFKFVIDVANTQTWDTMYSNTGAKSAGTLEEALRLQLQYFLFFGDAAIKESINTDLVAYIDSIKSTAGGLGTRYTAAGNTKIIPALESYQDAFPGIVTDGIIPNRFTFPSLNQDVATWKTRCALLGSPGLVFATDQARIRRAGNITDSDMLLSNYANIEASNSISVATPLTEDFRAYLLDKGAVSVNTWVPDMNAGEFANTNEMFVSRFDMPAVNGLYEMGSLMNYNLVLRKPSFTDEFATYGTEESRQNTRYEAILYTYACFSSPDTANPAVTPVIEYVKLK